MPRRLALTTLAVALLASLLPGAARAVAVTATDVLAELPVMAEATWPSYDRDLFQHWVDEDGNGCNTRAEVLARDSSVPVTYSSGCTVATGQWTSRYDGESWTLASDVDIDHHVPLEEAWQSGAHAWTAQQRRAYANDLDYVASLQVMTDNLNQSKGSRDPAQWLPPVDRCAYATEWVLVKYRWHLAVDATEAATLSSLLGAECGDPAVVPPTRADVPDPSGSAGPSDPGFTDVGPDHPFAAEVAWLAGSGVTTGYADGSFRPAASISRQAFAAFLYRYSHDGQDAPACTRQWFRDVPRSNQFCGAIDWLAGTGITSGYADGGFHPSAPITRQAIAAMLQRYREAAAPTSATCRPGAFSDIAASAFCASITWLADTGITKGYADGTFRPGAQVTRQAFAAYLQRYDAMFGPSDPPVVVSPPPVVTPPPTTPPTGPTPPANPGDTKNCSDFRTWREAQDWYERYFPYYGDVARLDQDKDGIACESLPGAP